MTISKAIAELQKLQSQLGDLPLVMPRRNASSYVYVAYVEAQICPAETCVYIDADRKVIDGDDAVVIKPVA